MKQLVFFFVIGLILMSSCKKAAYLTDEGVHDPRTPLSTYDYLAQHPAGLFDTLILVIDHFGLKEEVNNAKTFFAPTDYSIKRFYDEQWGLKQLADENATFSLEEMMARIVVDSLRAYLYDAPYSLGEASTQFRAINNLGGIPGFAYHKQLYTPADPSWSSQPTYALYYVKIRGEQDQVNDQGNVTTPAGDQADLRIRCQTTGIETSSGTLLHVLANTHTFIEDFVETQQVLN